jgi:hypothetical protein
MRDPKRDGENLYSYDAYFSVILVLVVERREEVDVGPETDADAVEENDGKF